MQKKRHGHPGTPVSFRYAGKGGQMSTEEATVGESKEISSASKDKAYEVSLIKSRVWMVFQIISIGR